MEKQEYDSGFLLKQNKTKKNCVHQSYFFHLFYINQMEKDQRLMELLKKICRVQVYCNSIALNKRGT